MAKRFWPAVFVLMALSGLQAQPAPKEELVKVRLLADANAIVPGKPFTVALELTMAPGWHTYWAFGGDAGLPTSIKWKLPEGFKAGPIQWPTPIKFVGAGDVVSYGYHDVVALLVEITPPLKAQPEDAVALEGKVSWLVCKESCIVGDGPVQLNLPISDGNQPANEDFFKEWSAKLPKPFPTEAKAAWSRNGDTLQLKIGGLSGVTDFFPLPGEAVIGQVKRTGDIPALFEIPLIDGPKDLTSLPGVVATGQGHDLAGWQLEEKSPSAPAATPVSTSTKSTPTTASTPPAPAAGGFLFNLFLGFVGGLILNVMPCVFPVISIKIYGFVQQGNNSRSEIFKYGAAFVAGIFTWFWALAIFFISVRHATGFANYSQQFQNPYFMLATSVLLLVVGLNFLGVFEVMLPQKAEAAAANASGHSGFLGTYFQGVFATLLGTACSAPVLGAALAYALGQPDLITFVIFTAIAAGMGFPYLLLAAFPAWTRFLPRPGNWMVIFKQAAGFVMLGFLIWALSVIGYQKDVEGLFWALIFLLCVAAACWLYGVFQQPGHSQIGRVIAFSLVAILLIGGGYYTVANEFANIVPSADSKTISRKPGGIEWEPFTPESYAEALKSNRIVYVDFTAKWCLTCLANKKAVLETPSIQKLFRENNVLAIQADYTRENPEIAKLLRQFGRVAVPLNVVFPAGHPDQPIILPELLTHGIVEAAIQQARTASSAPDGKPAPVAEQNPTAGIK